MPKYLTELELYEVSCVDEPANQGSRVLLFKSVDKGSSGKDGGQGEADGGGAGNGPPSNADKHKDESMTTKNTDAPLTQADVQKMISDAVAEAEKRAKAAQDAATVEVDKAKADAAKAKADAEAANKRAEDAEKSAAEERTAREVAALEKRAEAEFSALPGTATEKALALKAIAGLPEATVKTITAMLVAGQNAMKGAMRPRGSGDAPTGDGTAEAELNAAARELMKADGTLSFAAAYDKAVSAQPALYTKYLSERRAAAAA